MIILNRNVDTSKGQLRAGTDVADILPEDVCKDLLERGWAHESKGKEQNSESQQDETTNDENSNTGDESDSSESEDGTSEENSDDNGDVNENELTDDEVLYTDEESLSKMKAQDLKNLAKDIEIQGYANMNKAELVTAISKHFEEGDAE